MPTKLAPSLATLLVALVTSLCIVPQAVRSEESTVESAPSNSRGQEPSLALNQPVTFTRGDVLNLYSEVLSLKLATWIAEEGQDIKMSLALVDREGLTTLALTLPLVEA